MTLGELITQLEQFDGSWFVCVGFRAFGLCGSLGFIEGKLCLHHDYFVRITVEQLLSKLKACAYDRSEVLHVGVYTGPREISGLRVEDSWVILNLKER